MLRIERVNGMMLEQAEELSHSAGNGEQEAADRSHGKSVAEPLANLPHGHSREFDDISRPMKLVNDLTSSDGISLKLCFQFFVHAFRGYVT